MSEFKKIEDGKAELTCTIEGERWSEAKKKAFKKLKNNLAIKGFRKGQVPETLAKKYISDSEICFDAANAITKDVFEEALKEHDVELIDQASLNFNELDNDHVVMVFTCPVKPDVTIGDYKSLKYEVEEVAVDDKEVEDDIKRTLERKADLVVKEEGTVENGDTAVIDFEGFKDGVAFEGGKGENYDLVIGSGSFIPGFEEQLIGMKADEEKEINVTFPEDYQANDLRGAATTFKVTVHEIKTKVLPDLDDEFVKELKIDGVNTVDEYKANIKENLLNNKKYDAENKATEDLLNKFADLCEVNIPKVMIDQEADRLIEEQAQRLMYQGISLEQYQQIIGQNTEEMKAALEPSAIKRIKTSLCLEALAKQENIVITEDDINNQFDEMSKTYSMTVDEIKTYVSEDSIKNDLKMSKAIEILKNIK